MQIRAYQLYRYNPTLGDVFLVKGLEKGNIVQVMKPSDVGIHSHGTVFGNHVYVRDVYGTLTTMVFKNSLEKIGEHGTFVQGGRTYHYQQDKRNEWTAWEDGHDNMETVATSFKNLFEML